jgi:hypothetical protein
MAAKTKYALLVALLAACGILAAAEPKTFPLRITKCADLLMPPRQVTIGSEAISTYDSVGEDLENLRKEMNAMPSAGVVVYMPVFVYRRIHGATKTTFDGMVTVRFETQGSGKAVLEDILEPSKAVSEKQFELLLQSAQKASVPAREELQQVVPIDSGNDANKIVFIRDSNLYGLLPQTLGIDNGMAIASESLTAALAKREALAKLHAAPSDFTTVVGYPGSTGDYRAVFGNQPTAPLSTWQARIADLRKIATEQNLRPITADELRTFANKQQFLSKLEKANGIVMVIAHADGYSVRLPGSVAAITITPQDIGALHFEHSPFVMLRICNAVDYGYADAFARAGSVAVWANRGVITAEAANLQIQAFFQALKQNGNILEAIRQVNALDPQSKASIGLFSLLRSISAIHSIEAD